MLQGNEIVVDKKKIIGKKFSVMDIRNDVGLHNKPFFWCHVAIQGQTEYGFDDATGKKTVIYSDKFLEGLNSNHELINKLVKITEFVKPKHGFWYYRYEVIEEEE